MADPKLILTKRVRIERAPITLGYGEPGVGKTTFASFAPEPLFFCLEAGANELSVQRMRIADDAYPGGERDPNTYDELVFALGKLVALVSQKEPPPFKSVVIDTLDALEKLFHAKACLAFGKPGMADIGFGKGYDMSIDLARVVMSKLERIRDAGIHVILLAHSHIENFSNPEGADFNFWSLKLHKKLAPQWVEWADNVLFMRREQYAHEEKGKVRGVGSDLRMMHTQKTPTFVAKNRFNLPAKLPLRWFDYQEAMAAHRPADPIELLRHARELITKLPEELRARATARLTEIAPDNAPVLAQFVDYARAKVMTEGTTEKEETTT